MCDDNRPILTLTYPRAGANDMVSRLLVGMFDYYSGLAPDSFTVTADFAVNGIAPGENLAARFQPLSQGVWELKLKAPITNLPQGKVIVSVKDAQGNVSRLERKFSVATANTTASR